MAPRDAPDSDIYCSKYPYCEYVQHQENIDAQDPDKLLVQIEIRCRRTKILTVVVSSKKTSAQVAPATVMFDNTPEIVEALNNDTETFVREIFDKIFGWPASIIAQTKSTLARVDRPSFPVSSSSSHSHSHPMLSDLPPPIGPSAMPVYMIQSTIDVSFKVLCPMLFVHTPLAVVGPRRRTASICSTTITVSKRFYFMIADGEMEGVCGSSWAKIRWEESKINQGRPVLLMLGPENNLNVLTVPIHPRSPPVLPTIAPSTFVVNRDRESIEAGSFGML